MDASTVTIVFGVAGTASAAWGIVSSVIIMRRTKVRPGKADGGPTDEWLAGFEAGLGCSLAGLSRLTERPPLPRGRV